MTRFLVFIVFFSLLPQVVTAEEVEPLHEGEKKELAEKPKILFLDLTANMVKEEVAKIITSMVSAELGRHKEYEIITALDLRQLAELQVDRQKAGCMDDSCLSELAGAMGARYVVYGEVGKLGEKVILALNLFDSREAKAMNRVVLTLKGLGEVSAALPGAINELVDEKKLSGNNTVAADAVAPEEAGYPWGRVTFASLFAVAGASAAVAWHLLYYDDVLAKAEFHNEERTAASFQSANDAQVLYYAVVGAGSGVALISTLYAIGVMGSAGDEGE